MAAINICSNFGALKNKVWHCFHCFPIYFPWSDGTGCHDLRFLNVELSANFFTLLFHFHQEAFLWAHKPFLPESRPAYMMKNSWLWGKHCTWCRELTTVWVSFQVGGGTRVRGQCVFAANGEPYFTLWAFHLDWRLKDSRLKTASNSSSSYAGKSPSFCC